MAKVKIIPDYVFRNKDPYIVGIEVLQGRFRLGDMIIFDNGDKGVIIDLTNSKGKRKIQARKGEYVSIAIRDVHWKRSNERGHAIIKAP